jgi:hypothetical protein
VRIVFHDISVKLYLIFLQIYPFQYHSSSSCLKSFLSTSLCGQDQVFVNSRQEPIHIYKSHQALKFPFTPWAYISNKQDMHFSPKLCTPRPKNPHPPLHQGQKSGCALVGGISKWLISSLGHGGWLPLDPSKLGNHIIFMSISPCKQEGRSERRVEISVLLAYCLRISMINLQREIHVWNSLVDRTRGDDIDI